MAIVLRPHGKLNAHGAAKLKRKLGQLLTTIAAKQNTWIVDLGDVYHVDHNGLVSLIELRRQAEGANCAFVLRDLSESVKMTLDAAHLRDGFTIDPGDSSSQPKRTSRLLRRRRHTSTPQHSTGWQRRKSEDDVSRKLDPSEAGVDGDVEISQIPEIATAEQTSQSQLISRLPSHPLDSEMSVDERQWTTWRQ